MKTKYFTTFHVIWNNGLYEEIGDGMYTYPKRTQLFRQCELLFNQGKIISYGYERAFQ
jgi:hypothetical protein